MVEPPIRDSAEYLAIPAWRRWIVQFDISHNSICLAFFAFTSMWQTACTHFNMVALPATIWFILYIISCVLLCVALIIFAIRAVLYPSAYVEDFRHPRLVNFFYMPVMIGALLMLTTPPWVRTVAQFKVSFYVLSCYQLALTLYLYGEWLFSAHPPSFIHPLVFMQTIGFFLVANIGASAHLNEEAFAMFSVGCVFWLLVFMTNFQHITPALDKTRERPQPTFFLFIAPPAQAALSAVLLTLGEGANGDGSELVGFPSQWRWPPLARAFSYLDLFLYLLMVRLLPTFWRNKFAISWWAYIFPLSAAAGMVICRYSGEGGLFWGVLSAVLGVIASAAMVVVFCCTVWALVSGRVPRNAAALDGYYKRYYGQRGGAQLEHV
ncbi:S-type anion channel SLAH2 [Gracilariopsis chorda]|uniref:S-type anion channel SLAH2 n=1 Tax=Gracilariopsis chorda TaxID=448386 RepID=A0A2V3IGU7_9FLOR|nr:S-type anion channel SLAH2 [Gracilariopsis chorda]|eukprot:PXF41297.1 S-type anion channel SLAH2 [Gracilariopsis chorda]